MGTIRRLPYVSAISGGLFACTPITSFSQNVGLVAMTKVVNRFTIMFGALTLVIAGLFPPIGAFFFYIFSGLPYFFVRQPLYAVSVFKKETCDFPGL